MAGFFVGKGNGEGWGCSGAGRRDSVLLASPSLPLSLPPGERSHSEELHSRGFSISRQEWRGEKKGEGEESD